MHQRTHSSGYTDAEGDLPRLMGETPYQRSVRARGNFMTKYCHPCPTIIHKLYLNQEFNLGMNTIIREPSRWHLHSELNNYRIVIDLDEFFSSRCNCVTSKCKICLLIVSGIEVSCTIWVSEVEKKGKGRKSKC